MSIEDYKSMLKAWKCEITCGMMGMDLTKDSIKGFKKEELEYLLNDMIEKTEIVIHELSTRE